MFFNGIKKIHFIGIGGIGMSGIAEILKEKKFQVTGSDISENNNTRRLRNLGIKILISLAFNNILFWLDAIPIILILKRFANLRIFESSEVFPEFEITIKIKKMA